MYEFLLLFGIFIDFIHSSTTVILFCSFSVQVSFQPTVRRDSEAMATGISSSHGSQDSIPDKANASHDEGIASNVITDADLRIGEKGEVADEEAFRLQQLTLEEQVLEKKLRKRIDFLIMPLVIIVYMLNYIER